MIGYAIAAIAGAQALLFLGLVLIAREVRLVRLEHAARDPLAKPFGDMPHVVAP